jgi:hypothetical protein
MVQEILDILASPLLFLRKSLRVRTQGGFQQPLGGKGMLVVGVEGTVMTREDTNKLKNHKLMPFSSAFRRFLFLLS